MLLVWFCLAERERLLLNKGDCVACGILFS